jgi:hypothetical protein
MMMMTVGAKDITTLVVAGYFTLFVDEARNWCQSEDDTSPRVWVYIDREAYFNRMEHDDRVKF